MRVRPLHERGAAGVRSNASRQVRARSVVALVATLALLGGAAACDPLPPAPDDPCALTEILVNPCRPHLGAVADGYPGVGGWRQQILAHEARVGKQVDVVHSYKSPGRNTLTSDERYFVSRGSILYVNWKPSETWGPAGGGNASVNAGIDTFASQIASVAPAKVMVAIYGEPERYATPGTSACSQLRGNKGSPAQYRQMWANVQSRFEAAGVDNVVWAMNYLGFYRWDCLFPELWPGNDRVDWIMWDPYIGPGQRFEEEVGYFYEALERRTDAQHDFTSKPWGIAEFGFWHSTNSQQSQAYRMYDDAIDFVTSGDYPRIKLWEPFDMISGGIDVRIGYTGQGVADPEEQRRYNRFAHLPLFTDPPPPDTSSSTTASSSSSSSSTTTSSTTTTTAPPGPTVVDHFEGCDAGAETGLSCLGGTYATPVWPTLQTGDAHEGTRSVQVTNTTGSTGTYGLNVKPHRVQSTTPGTTYSGSVWVKASHVGMPVRLLLRERRSNNSSPGYSEVTWTATHTGWQRIDAAYTGREVGNSLTMSVYAPSMAASRWFRADTFRLTSPSP